MIARTGKIAQLPKFIRDDLNQRLENGKQGPELLKWLNALPETQELLAEKFEDKPITTSNLSDWRAGGYQDWQRHQAREQRIQRISESSNSLAQHEDGDLFENFARIAVAELAADFDELYGIKDRDTRWQRLRELCRELARLQNGYNRSRWAQLAWTKFNDLNSGTVDQPDPAASQLETPNSMPQTLSQTDAEVPNRAKSYGATTRYIHQAPCGCVCRKCHPEDGPYPYWDAERDSAARKSSEFIQKPNGESFYVLYWPCDCTCQRCDSKNGQPEGNGHPRQSLCRMIYRPKCRCGGICKKCHAPDSKYPLAEAESDWAQRPGPIRGEDGISKCPRISYCECTCDECERTKFEQSVDNPLPGSPRPCLPSDGE